MVIARRRIIQWASVVNYSTQRRGGRGELPQRTAARDVPTIGTRIKTNWTDDTDRSLSSERPSPNEPGGTLFWERPLGTAPDASRAAVAKKSRLVASGDLEPA